MALTTADVVTAHQPALDELLAVLTDDTDRHLPVDMNGNHPLLAAIDKLLDACQVLRTRYPQLGPLDAALVVVRLACIDQGMNRHAHAVATIMRHRASARAEQARWN